LIASLLLGTSLAALAAQVPPVVDGVPMPPPVQRMQVPVAAPPAPPAPPISEELRAYIETRGQRLARFRYGSIGFEDYPASALREGAQGTVAFRYVIGTDGRVVSCEIVESSGHAILDHTACALAQRRFRFYPAQDEQGRPTTETRTQRVRWELPEPPPPPSVGQPPLAGSAPPLPPRNYHWSRPLDPGVFEAALERHLAEAVPGPAKRYFGYVMGDDYPTAAIRAGAQGNVQIRYTIGTDGRVSGCEILASSGNASLDGTSCRLVTSRFLFLPAIGADGRAIAETKTQTIAWRMPADSAPAPVAQEPLPPPPETLPPPPRA